MSEDLNKKIDKALEDLRAPFPSKDASWDRLMMRIESTDSAQVNKNKRFTALLFAASFAALAAFFMVFDQDLDRIETPLAQQKTLELPDGSEVILNASSYVEYDEDAFLKTRQLTLDGEAFFKVKKGSKFDVVTDQGTVSVLGTSFNVCDREDFFEVTCETGKVLVKGATNEVMLTPGYATDNRNGILVDRFEKSDSQSWTRGFFLFEDRSVDFVFEEVERQFGVDIAMEGIGQRFYTGEFESADLETAMTVICQPLGLDFEISDDRQIVVTNK